MVVAAVDEDRVVFLDELHSRSAGSDLGGSVVVVLLFQHVVAGHVVLRADHVATEAGEAPARFRHVATDGHLGNAELGGDRSELQVTLPGEHGGDPLEPVVSQSRPAQITLRCYDPPWAAERFALDATLTDTTSM